MITNRAIFWDRDGVLVQLLADRQDGLKNVGPQKFDDFKVMEGAREVLKQIKAKGFLNIMATNQPDIARNKLSWEELNRMHDFLKTNVPALDAIYVCPHHDQDACHCRKPKSGLLLDAAKDYHLDLNKCFMVGDAQKDIDAAKNAGVKSILFSTHYNQGVWGYDFAIQNLAEIVQIVV